MNVKTTYTIELNELERGYLQDICDHYMSGQTHDASDRFDLAAEIWKALRGEDYV